MYNKQSEQYCGLILRLRGPTADSKTSYLCDGFRYEKRRKADRSCDRRHQPYSSFKVPTQQSHNKVHQWQGPLNYTGTVNQSLPWWHDRPSTNGPFFFDFAGSSSQFPPSGVGNWGAVQCDPGTVSSSHRYGPVDQWPADNNRAQKSGSDKKRDRSFRANDRDRNGRVRSERSSAGKSPAAKRKAVEEGPADDTVCVKLSEQTTSVINDILNGGVASVTCTVPVNGTEMAHQKTPVTRVPEKHTTRPKEIPKRIQPAGISSIKDTSIGCTKMGNGQAHSSTSKKQTLAPSATQRTTTNESLFRGGNNQGIVNKNMSGRSSGLGTTCKIAKQNEGMMKSVQRDVRTVLQSQNSNNTNSSLPKTSQGSASTDLLKSPARQFNPVCRNSDSSEHTKEVVSPAANLACGDKVIARKDASSSTASIQKTNLMKLTSTLRSRREQIELEQMLYEHASRKTSRKPLPAATVEPQATGHDSLSIMDADVVITPVSQAEVARDIGLDLSELDSTADSTRGTSKNCVVVDDDSNEDGSIGNAVQQDAGPVSPRGTSSTVVSGVASTGILSDTSQSPQTALHSVQNLGNNGIQQEVIVRTDCNTVLTRTSISESTTTASNQTALDNVADPGNQQEPLSTVLQISLQEEVVRKQLEDVRLEINQLRMQMMMMKNQLDSRMHVRATVSLFFITIVYLLLTFHSSELSAFVCRLQLIGRDYDYFHCYIAVFRILCSHFNALNLDKWMLHFHCQLLLVVSVYQ